MILEATSHHPLFVTTPPGETARLFVVEGTGQIRIFRNGTLLSTPFLDISGQLFSGFEQGILGLAFPPDYATSRYFVVYNVRPDTFTVLSRFHVTSAGGTGDLYIGDVGNDVFEEVDIVSHTSNGVENLGWRIMEGPQCFGGGTCSMTGLTLPVVSYNHNEGCSVIGGYVYRGAAMPALRGTYFYTDFCSAWVRTFRYVGGVATNSHQYDLLDPSELPTSFGEDADGELYITTESGNVYRIVAK